MIREMTLDDVDSVYDIEKATFSDPWSKGSFIEDIYSPVPYDIVYDLNGEIIGYASVWFYFDDAHLANIAVKDNFRHKGYASEIIEFIIEKSKERKSERILLEVRVSNINAIKLYEKFNFKIIHRMKKFYEDNDEDGYLMELKFEK